MQVHLFSFQNLIHFYNSMSIKIITELSKYTYRNKHVKFGKKSKSEMPKISYDYNITGHKRSQGIKNPNLTPFKKLNCLVELGHHGENIYSWRWYVLYSCNHSMKDTFLLMLWTGGKGASYVTLSLCEIEMLSLGEIMTDINECRTIYGISSAFPFFVFFPHCKSLSQSYCVVIWWFIYFLPSFYSIFLHYIIAGKLFATGRM